MKIGIVGAAGFVGRNLVSFLLEKTDHEIFAFSSDIKEEDFKQNARLKINKCDVLDKESIASAICDISVLVYLVHLMDQKGDFFNLEEKSAHNVGSFLKKSKNFEKIIYLDGLGRDEEDLAKHLKSRHNTGVIFRNYLDNVIEFRASIIIGKGSASFEAIRALVLKSKILFFPKTINTKTQPILLEDVLNYIFLAIEKDFKGHHIFEIGGPQVFSYFDLISFYKKQKKTKTILIKTPFLFLPLYKILLKFFLPKVYLRVVKSMLDSLKNETIVTNDKAQKFFPEIIPSKIEKGF